LKKTPLRQELEKRKKCVDHKRSKKIKHRTAPAMGLGGGGGGGGNRKEKTKKDSSEPGGGRGLQVTWA